MKSFLDLVAGAACFLGLVVLCGCLLPVFSGGSSGGRLFADMLLCGIGLGAVTLYALCQEAMGGR
ncbi:MAG: hypothetical protein U0804_16070 [Gemmataceae bacterium]